MKENGNLISYPGSFFFFFYQPNQIAKMACKPDCPWKATQYHYYPKPSGTAEEQN